MKNYRVMSLGEAKSLNPDQFDWIHPDDWEYGLFICDEEGVPVKHIFIDGIEPEDAIIGRDLAPLVNEILKLAEENNRLQRENEKLSQTINELRDWPNTL